MASPTAPRSTRHPPRPPGPRGIGFRALRALRRDPLGFLTGLRDRYGGLVGLRLGPTRYFAIADPQHAVRVLVEDAAGYKKGMSLERARVVLGDGLLTSEGELHRRQARRSAPAFGRRRIVEYAPTIQALAEEVSRGWHDGADVDVAAEMTRLTLRVVAETLLGTTLEPHEADRVGRALTDVLEEFEWLLTHPLGPLRERLPTPRVRRFRTARGVLDATVERLIAERRQRGGGDDLLAQLLAAHTADGDPQGGALLHDEVLTLLVAGHETTASWLSFTWLALAEHPGVEAALHAELDAELAGRAPTLDAVERLPYLRAVLDESLRLYPPAWGVGRRALRDGELGGCPVPKGAILAICQYAIHRDPRLWPEPERFEPERWLGGRVATVPRGAYLPFADGPRRCIAEHFARAEALVVMATLASRWRLRRTSTAPVVLDPKVTLRPRGGLPMRVEARS